MLKNRPLLIAIISLAVIGGISTVIFLEESISISDRAEAENTGIVNIEPVSKVETEEYYKHCENYNILDYSEYLVSYYVDLLEYEIVGGEILNIYHIKNDNSFVFLIDAVDNGLLTVDLLHN